MIGLSGLSLFLFSSLFPFGLAYRGVCLFFPLVFACSFSFFFFLAAATAFWPSGVLIVFSPFFFGLGGLSFFAAYV